MIFGIYCFLETTEKKSKVTGNLPEDQRFLAQQLLTRLFDHKYSPTFSTPVDTETYTDYLNIVKHPMDFSTIQVILIILFFHCIFKY